MSGVYIPGVSKPIDCEFCVFCDDEYCVLHGPNEYKSWAAEYENCPLIPVPDHGRLGDLDKLESGLRLMAKYQEGDRQQGILGCCETIHHAPTIIPADKEAGEC